MANILRTGRIAIMGTPEVVPLPRMGINVSGAEYSWETYPDTANLDYLETHGFTLLRCPFAWEKIQPTLNAALNATELGKLKTFLTNAAARGMDVVIDMHNYGRYNTNWATSGNIGPGQGDIIGSVALPYTAYADVWGRIAAELDGHAGLAGYGIMNEPYNMGGDSVWPTAAQAAVDAIRAEDVNTDIYVCGVQWAVSFYWRQYNEDLNIIDPSDKIIYEAHCYFTPDTGGTYSQTYDEQGATPTLGVTRIAPFLEWLEAKGFRGFVGEFGVPEDDARWLTVMDNFIRECRRRNVGGTYWEYLYRTASGAEWWPTEGESMAVIPLYDQGVPQFELMKLYTTTS